MPEGERIHVEISVEVPARGASWPAPIAQGGPRVQVGYATRSEWKAGVDGGLVYVEDHPIRLYLDAFDLGQLANLTDERAEAQFAHVAISTDKTLQGQDLVIALEPLSSYWIYPARFQTLARSTERRRSALNRAMEHPEGLLEGLANLGVSPLETGDHLLAICFKPERPADTSVATPRVYRDVHPGRVCRALHGIVPNKDDGIRELLVSNAAARLRELTEADRLPIVPTWVMPIDALGERPLRTRALQSQTKELAEKVLEGSALRALAGPKTLTPGRPVASRMVELYCQQMYDLDRRVRRAAVTPRQEHPSEISPSGSPEKETLDTSADPFPITRQADLEYIAQLAAEASHPEYERLALELIERHVALIKNPSALQESLKEFETHDAEVEVLWLRVLEILRKLP